jgi:hypothetical protein
VSGAKPAHRNGVRGAGADGVQEQGEAAQGLTWNTGYPSRAGKRRIRNKVATGVTTTWAQGADDGTRAQRICIVIALYPTQGLQTKCGEEPSGSLSGFIVTIESWRTGDGPEPGSSEGSRPESRTSAWNHALNPPRK